MEANASCEQQKSTCEGGTATIAVVNMPARKFQWPEGGVTRVPFQVFSDPAIYAME